LPVIGLLAEVSANDILYGNASRILGSDKWEHGMSGVGVR
jgi:hypothetical protein